MLKRHLTNFTLAALLLQGFAAQATDLDAAFGTLLTYDTPGVYSTTTKTQLSAGGVDVRFPRGPGAITLLSITPPSIVSAGCNGISAHFGGFSFVSGKQIEKLIKTIGQNAVGMVVSVVIKTLCPICDAVIQAMTKLAQDAARLQINSCAIGTQIAQSLVGDAKDYKFKDVCTGKATADGLTEDELSAYQGIDSVCADTKAAMGKVQEFLNPPPKADGSKDPDSVDQDKARIANLVGNRTWNNLNAIFGQVTADTSEDEVRNRMLLMNVMGVEIARTADEKGQATYPVDYRNATISPKALFDLFMCGAPKSYGPRDGGVGPADNGVSVADDRVTREYCSIFYAAATEENKGMGKSGGYGYKVFMCPKDDYANCVNVQEVELKDADILRGYGFLPQTEKILADAVNAVRTNNQNGFDPKFIALVNRLNFPIYQAVNAAAVYPASASDLLSTMSVLVAESLVTAKLEDLLTPQGKNTNRATISQEAAQRIYGVFENIQKTHASQRESFGRMMAVQEGAVQAIRQVNLAIQKQVLTPQLLGNQKYGEAVAASITK